MFSRVVGGWLKLPSFALTPSAWQVYGGKLAAAWHVTRLHPTSPLSDAAVVTFRPQQR